MGEPYLWRTANMSRRTRVVLKKIQSNPIQSVQARITKFGPEVQNTLVLITFLGWLTLILMVKFNFKFYLIWVCPCPKSQPIKVRISEFGTEMHLSMATIPFGCGLDNSWASILFLIVNLVNLTYLHRVFFSKAYGPLNYHTERFCYSLFCAQCSSSIIKMTLQSGRVIRSKDEPLE